MALFLRLNSFQKALHQPATVMTTAQVSTSTLSEPSEPVLSRGELEELHAKYREMKHGINNTFAVIMALSELGQRNPAHLEKLAKAVLQRSPEVVSQLTVFGEQLGAKLRQRSPAI
jgi:hypothetical protein